MLHIGKLVKAKLKERAHTCVWLAQQMDCSRTNLYKIFNKEYVGSIQGSRQAFPYSALQLL